jgi:hypothetical protein
MEESKDKKSREIFVVCAYADEGGGLVHEIIRCENANKETPKEKIIEEGLLKFKEKEGYEAASVLGPFYEWKGSQVYQSKPRKEIDVSNWNHVPAKKATAIYKDWEVTVRFFKEDDTVGMVFYNQSLIPGKKNKPSAKAVYLSELKDLKLMESTTNE